MRRGDRAGVESLPKQVVLAAGGFSYLIRQPGSYVFTGDLTLRTASTTAIRILEHDVTLDRNGFAIRGNQICDPDSCPAGQGKIWGFGQDCARLGPDARVEGLVATSCGASGIFVEERALVLGNRVAFCGTSGLR